MNLIPDTLENEVSYIRPRDPSIRCMYNRNNLNRVKINMQFSLNEENMESSSSDPEEHKNYSEQNCVQIYLRVKPSKGNLEDYIIHENELIYKEQDARNTKAEETVYKKIALSKIFHRSKQVNIFNESFKVKVFEFINGKDSSIFTYGTRGSGRNYTTVGTAEEPGLLIRSLEYIFKTLPELPEIPSVKPTPDGKIIKLTSNQAKSELISKSSILKSRIPTDKFKNMKLYQAMQERLQNEPFAFLDHLEELSIGVWVSFAAIDHEEIFDLLQSSVNTGKRKLRIAVTNGKPYITDLTHICVSNGSEAFQVYQYGKQNMECMKTNTNRNSCSANTIFTIKIAHTLSIKNTKFISAFNICNLATGMDNSVIVLGKCIATLKSYQEQQNQKYYIPYRDSKLTQLFHRVCLGLQDFSMIINVDFSKEKLRETQNILNFSALPKETISKNVVSEYMALKSEYAFALDQKIKELREVINERRAFHENLVKDRSRIFQMEKQTLIQGYEELIRDTKEFFNKRKKNAEEEYERLYQMELHAMRIEMRRKIELKKKKERGE